MTAIFNSLGSNYSVADVKRLREVRGGADSREKLKAELKKYLNDKPVQIELFYKGREALEVGLRSLNLPAGSEVGITGFTCYVVEQSVRRADLEPVFLDLEKDSLNFGVKSLEKAAKGKGKGANLRVLVLQNTFGFQMEELVEVLDWAKKNKVIVIEDAAHGLGLHYQLPNGTFCGPFGTACGKNGAKMGTLGEMAIFSFSQDKMLDVVSGGALVINNPEVVAGLPDRTDLHCQKGRARLDQVENDAQRTNVRLCSFSTSDFPNQSSQEVPAFQEVSEIQQQKDRNYAWRTRLIRKWYECGLGKLWHQQWKTADKLSRPMAYVGDEKVQKMTTWQAERAEEILRESFERDLDRRRRVASYYWRNLDSEWRVPDITPAKIELGACLRWPILVPERKRAGLIEYLAKRKIYVSDVWYDRVIAPGSYARKSSYKSGKCPKGEKVAAQIFNLPTHKQINLRKAKKIVKLVNKYLRDGK